MKHEFSQPINEFFISFFLPEGLLEWFEIVKVVEDPNTESMSADVLYNSILNVYLDERDNCAEAQLNLNPHCHKIPFDKLKSV